MALTKKSIIDKFQSDLGFSKTKSTELFESLIELIKATLESGEDVLVSGFGKFCVQEKHQRKGRNPATGQEMMLCPRRIVTFRCSGKLRDKINS
ncbi:integration host factor subunit alpha [Desulfosarcina widdelii]|uniref:Integration host factor subunit alpha n=1 Tax=Desulfosarcina widdelii TaxID=947919 RepID=A0A5K7Z4R2_9BACT|nr:integration host factor subunit alpha [Desulfosarcina widdelii]BBO74913.1 integration host factor subunit alpha [Desulfosarcina widdelii]